MSSFGKVVGVLLAAVVGGIYLTFPSTKETPEQKQSRQAAEATAKAAVCSSADNALNELISLRVIMKHSPDWSDVQVSRDWYSTPLEDKKNIAKMIATCKAQNVTTIRDGFSGKKVAEYGVFGTRIHQ